MLSSLCVIAITIAAQVTAPAAADPAAVATPPEAVVLPPPQPAAVVPAATPVPDAKPHGMEAGATSGAQIGAGVGACCVGACISVPCAFVPFVGGLLGNVVTGLVIGGTETVVGDALGQKRAAMLWPVLASSGIMVVGGLVNLGVGLAFGLNSAVLDPGVLVATNTERLNVAFGVSVGVSLTTVVAAVVVPTLVYQFTGVDKEPGDTGGFGVPGFVSPADPTGTRATKTAASPSTPTTSTPPPPPTSPPTSSPSIGY